ncbi:hypothetical protein BJY21_002635 [Kineosphaera limosa]|uniref:AbrB family transcriptional regulator n=1 Tax=Kineosphaera limosa NBRC 100340 TaxID=1184609 RepID=K6VG88_9MICO|nr:AbrB family transcriptional regulator [Kineosphaera limosa]NYE01451.1 hypothetical protein [Kineosphaera limosa]GAB95198.1 hypothetical protein KILIM_017_00430 [Kineosphaera limosa NBRC 100340]
MCRGAVLSPADGAAQGASSGPEPESRLLGWAVLALLVALASGVFAATGLPSPLLFGAVLGSMLYAVLLTGRRLGSRPLPTLAMPPWGSPLGQAIIGVSIGALIDPRTVGELGGWTGVAIVGVGVATLAVSIGSGLLLARGGAVSTPTGVFSMIAGGASGITAIARELGADDRVVSVVQYVRVLVILVGMPVVAALVFRPPSTGQVLDLSGEASWPVSLVFVAVCGGLGTLLGRRLRLPAGALLGPLTLAVLIGVFVAPRLGFTFGVPTAVQAVGYLLIGVTVGVRFTVAALRSIARILPAALALIVAAIVICAGFGLLLARWTGHSALEGYLATTPGGLYAVLAIAVDSGADLTFVLAVQVIRLLIMLAAAPLLAWLLRPRL